MIAIHIFNIIIGILAVIGMAATLGAIILIVLMARKGDDDPQYDERQRMEDEEQLEYLRRWRENGNHKT